VSKNKITLLDRVLIKYKIASFIIIGGQDNIQHIAGQLMVFFTELGFTFPPFAFMGWSRGGLKKIWNTTSTIFQSHDIFPDWS
jgi:hypothetical protein